MSFLYFHALGNGPSRAVTSGPEYLGRTDTATRPRRRRATRAGSAARIGPARIGPGAASRRARSRSRSDAGSGSGYSPWGFGGVGFGSYYGSFYDPYVFYDPFSPWYGSYRGYGSYGSYGGYGYPAYGYGYPSSYYSRLADGELRLKVRPRSAQVFVDGYYVGVVDDFDGIFQRLHLPSGGHRIEVRAPGYETLTFDVQIRFDDTTTFEGDLRPIR
jgi:hypothetical protein